MKHGNNTEILGKKNNQRSLLGPTGPGHWSGVAFPETQRQKSVSLAEGMRLSSDTNMESLQKDEHRRGGRTGWSEARQ